MYVRRYTKVDPDMYVRTYVHTDSLAGATLHLCPTQLCMQSLHYTCCSVEGGEGLVTLGVGFEVVPTTIPHKSGN